MSEYYTPVGTGYFNPDWTAADTTFFLALGKARGSELLPEEKDAYFNWMNARGGEGGSAPQHLILAEVGDTFILA